MGRTEQWRAVLPASTRDLGSSSAAVKIKIAPATGIHKIRHVVIIMQENRSFDSYFGTFPGADGIPAGVCVPDPGQRQLRGPVPRPLRPQLRRPARLGNALADIDSGRMDGFVAQAEQGMGCTTGNPNCSPCTETSQRARAAAALRRRDGLPRRARDPQLLDLRGGLRAPGPHVRAQRLVEPARSPVHGLGVVGVLQQPVGSRPPVTATSRTPIPTPPSAGTDFSSPNDGQLHYAWTDITYLLHQQNVSWAYYVFQGTEPDCENDASMTCAPVQQGPQTPGIWNPLPSFTDVTAGRAARRTSSR